MEEKHNLLINFTKSVDILGMTPQFLVEDKIKYKTVCGGFLSIILYILTICAFFFFGEELYLKQDPKITVSNSYDSIPRSFNLTKNNFNFIIGILGGNDNELYIDPQIYNIKIGFYQYNYFIKPNGKLEYIEKKDIFDLEKCSKHELFCYDSDIFGNITLAGNLESYPINNVNYFQFNITTCKNGTDSNIICKTQEEINEKIEGSYLVFSYQDTILDPKNFTNPNSFTLKNYYTLLSDKYIKHLFFYMKNIDYISDSGILFSSEEKKNFIQTENIRESIDYNTEDIIIKGIFMLSNNRDIIKRNYNKIQDVLAKVGGFIQSITFILVIFNYFYSTINFYIFLMNKLYFYDLNEIIKTKEPSNLKNYISNYDNTIKMRDIETNKKKDFDNCEIDHKKNGDFNNQNSQDKSINNNNNVNINLNKSKICKNNISQDNCGSTINIFEENPKSITDSNRKSLIIENSSIQKSHIENKSYIEDKFITRINMNNLNNDKFHDNGLNINNKFFKVAIDDNQKNIFNVNKNTEKIRYSLCNKFLMIPILCFDFCKSNKNKNNISLRKRKKIIYEDTFEKISKKFDVVNYLRIFDDIKLIKSLIFADYQIDIIELINQSKDNYKYILTETLLDQNESLKKMKDSNNPYDDKLEIALKSKNLI